MCLRKPSPLEKKNKENIFQLYESGLGSKKVKPKKYEAHNKGLKKLLPILRCKNLTNFQLILTILQSSAGNFERYKLQIDKDELCNKKLTFISDLFSKK